MTKMVAIVSFEIEISVMSSSKIRITLDFDSFFIYYSMNE